MKQVKQLPNAYINESIKNIDRLSERVCEYMQIDSKQHKLHVLQRQQEVVIIIEDSILAGQLRYQQKDILTDLNRSLLCEYKTIKIKMSPPKMIRAAKKAAAKSLPDDISALLSQTRRDLDAE